MMQVDLAKVIPRWAMHSSLIALFGDAFVESLGVGLDAFLSHFEQFDKYFEVRLACIMHAPSQVAPYVPEFP
jgi:hypothetical protein